MPTRVAILGSTGSIGTQALDAIDHLNLDGFDFDVVALACGSKRDTLRRQGGRWPKATLACVADEGPEVLVAAARRADVDVIVHAVVGAAGLPASFAALEAGKRVCLANKESLVVAGGLLTGLAAAHGGEIVPIDSEHTAIFQSIAGARRDEPTRILLTCSGGPFRDAEAWPADRLANATVNEALDHPTWSMGGKITIDSATLFNKGFELIEAVHLYGLPDHRIEIVVHPQSLVHSMVEYADGSTIAHLSPNDMRLPIAYALTHPRRGKNGTPTLDWRASLCLNFEPPDEARFGSLALCRQAVREGGVKPCYLNAANEVAVRAFMDGRLSFGAITAVVAQTLAMAPDERPDTLESLMSADARARAVASRLVAAEGSGS